MMDDKQTPPLTDDLKSIFDEFFTANPGITYVLLENSTLCLTVDVCSPTHKMGVFWMKSELESARSLTTILTIPLARTVQVLKQCVDTVQ